MISTSERPRLQSLAARSTGNLSGLCQSAPRSHRRLQIGLVGALFAGLLAAGWARPAILSLCVQTLVCELRLTE